MNESVTFSNIISLFRAPLALCLFSNDPVIRFFAIFFAMITDFLDGFFARRWKQVSKVGIMLDPLMDKLFVFLALFIFYFEGSLKPWQFACFFTRDIGLIFFGIWMLAKKDLQSIRLTATRCSKITTALQFFILLGIALNFSIPSTLYITMGVIGIFSFIELLVTHRKKESHT